MNAPAPTELLKLAEAALEYIDAIPKDIVLPAMPGFDRDWAADVIRQAASVERAEIDLTNHHNALKCPYCNPKGLTFAVERAEVAGEAVREKLIDVLWDALCPGMRQSEIDREYYGRAVDHVLRHASPPRSEGVRGSAVQSDDTIEALATRLREAAHYCTQLSDLKQHCREVADELMRAPAQASWMPIETAPNYGEVLLWWKYAGVGVGSWDEEGNGWRCEGDETVPKNQSDCTHWMPKPAGPPVPSAEGKTHE